MKERFTIAAVQPDSVWGREEWRNAEVAYRAVEEAAARGSELMTFPEGFPGPCNGPLDSGGQLDTPPIERLRELAKRHGVYIVGSDLEPSPELPAERYGPYSDRQVWARR